MRPTCALWKAAAKLFPEASTKIQAAFGWGCVIPSTGQGREGIHRAHRSEGE